MGLLSDLGENSRKQSFALDGTLSGTGGKSMIAHLSKSYLESRKNGAG